MTTEFQVPSTETVTLDQLNDMLITAVEGGINYWAVVRNYDWSGIDSNPQTPVTVEIREDEEKTWHKVSSTDLVGILPRIRSESSQARGWNISEIMENCDADIADIAVQLLLFGEVRYG